ncbi:Organic cation transporter protein, partial [Stegodyphus mimosarum]
METKKPSDISAYEVQDISDVVGSFGPWQRRVFIIFFYINIVGIWQNLSITFLAPNMNFWCIEPNSTDSFSLPVLPNSTDQMLRRLSNNTSKDECMITVYSEQNATMVSFVNVSQPETVPCTKWQYDTSYTSQTLVSEFDLVCDREWLVSLAKSIYMIGFLVSVILFGQLSDWIRRLPTIFISYIVTTISLLLFLLSTSYLMFVILRFFQAFGRTGLTTIGFVLLMEIVGPQHRTEAGIAIQLGWTVGFITLALVGYLFRHWFWFQVAMSVPILPLVFFYKFIPESPRWLLIQGKVKQLEKILIEGAKLNGQELKYQIKDLKMLKEQKTGQNRSTSNVFDLFRSPKMRSRVLNMIYLWIVNAFMYYGLSYNTNDLAGNPYLNFFLAGALEIPAYASVFFGIKKWGRRPTLTFFMLAGGCACAAIIAVPESILWLTTAFAMIGKFCISGSFGVLYLYTSELFPTVVRNVAIGTCSMWARVGSILAPFVKELGKATHVSVPNIIYAILAVSSGLLALLLPETKGQKMPDSLLEGEHFGEHGPLKDRGNCSKNEK